MNENSSENHTRLKNLLNSKKKRYILIIISLALLLTVYFASLNGEKETQVTYSAADANISGISQDISFEIENILSTIKGAGNVKVLISYGTTKELVTAKETQSDSITTFADDKEASITENKSSQIVTVKNDNGENALVLKEIMPEISGVIVTAQGAGDISVKMKLIDAVTTLLDIPQNKVDVFEMQDINNGGM